MTGKDWQALPLPVLGVEGVETLDEREGGADVETWKREALYTVAYVETDSCRLCPFRRLLGRASRGRLHPTGSPSGVLYPEM